jgi:hypothetical protein
LNIIYDNQLFIWKIILSVKSSKRKKKRWLELRIKHIIGKKYCYYYLGDIHYVRNANEIYLWLYDYDYVDSWLYHKFWNYFFVVNYYDNYDKLNKIIFS